MKGLDRQEFITRAKALTDEQKEIAAAFMSTDMLQAAIRKRDDLCTDILKALVAEINKLSDEATIQDKEAAIKECGNIIRLYDARYNMEA